MPISGCEASLLARNEVCQVWLSIDNNYNSYLLINWLTKTRWRVQIIFHFEAHERSSTAQVHNTPDFIHRREIYFAQFPSPHNCIHMVTCLEFIVLIVAYRGLTALIDDPLQPSVNWKVQVYIEWVSFSIYI